MSQTTFQRIVLEAMERMSPGRAKFARYVLAPSPQ